MLHFSDHPKNFQSKSALDRGLHFTLLAVVWFGRTTVPPMKGQAPVGRNQASLLASEALGSGDADFWTPGEPMLLVTEQPPFPPQDALVLHEAGYSPIL